MLRLRRTLAFAARVHNYLLLLYVFTLGLFVAQLWWPASLQFKNFVTYATFFLGTVGVWYAILLLLISLFLWIIDHVFPVMDVLTTLMRTVAFVIGWVLVTVFTKITEKGFSISL
jgi:ABC-type methionine transport system permease subunit